MKCIVTGLAATVFVLLSANAQPAEKDFRIGLCHVGLDHVRPSLDGLREGMKALGYDVGTDRMLALLACGG